MYKRCYKRLLDVLISLITLIVICPFLIVLTILLSLANKGSCPFFIQERPGKDGKLFKIIKYKTMTDEKDSSGNIVLSKFAPKVYVKVPVDSVTDENNNLKESEAESPDIRLTPRSVTTVVIK